MFSSVRNTQNQKFVSPHMRSKVSITRQQHTFRSKAHSGVMVFGKIHQSARGVADGDFEKAGDDAGRGLSQSLVKTTYRGVNNYGQPVMGRAGVNANRLPIANGQKLPAKPAAPAKPAHKPAAPVKRFNRGRVPDSKVRGSVARGGKASGRLVKKVMVKAQAVGAKVIAAVAAMVASASLPVIAVLTAVISVVALIASIFSFIFGGWSEEEAKSRGVIGVIGDDYPWADKVRTPAGIPTSVYNTINHSTNFYYGNCTDFVFWRVNRDMGASLGNWIYSHGSLTPLGGNGAQWGKPGNMPGWKRVKTPDEILPGDVISYSQGVYGSHPLYGHVAYVAKNDGQKIVVENYGYAQYYLTEHDYASLRKWLKSGSVVVVQNPELTGEKRKALAAKNTTGDKS